MSEHPLVKEWLSQLQANGYRITHARRVIVEELVKSQKALEPVDLFTHLPEERSRTGSGHHLPHPRSAGPAGLDPAGAPGRWLPYRDAQAKWS